MTMAQSISIILPTYNERENIQQLIPAIEEAFQDRVLEILVVDDNSPDGTAERAEALGRTFGNVRIIRRPGRAGLGSALRCGYDAAYHDILISCDADRSFVPEDLARMVEMIERGYDLVLGSRHTPGGRYETPRWSIRLKYGVSRLGNWILRCATGLRVHDFSANCRAIRRQTWHKIQTSETTNALLLEMILRVSGMGGRVTEIPVAFLDRRYGRSKLNLWVEIPKFLAVMGRHLIRHWMGGLAGRHR